MKGEHQHEQRNEDYEGVLRPRVWIGSLADYNAGLLHGAWLDAAQEPEELEAAVSGLLARSPTPGAEEWAIFDSDDFVGLRIDEHESLETVSRLARGLVEHGAAFAGWAEIIGRESDDLMRFQAAYLGRWDSLSQYAEHLFEELGYADLLARTMPAHMQPYVRFDAESFGRDLTLSGEISYTDSTDGGVWLFDGRL